MRADYQGVEVELVGVNLRDCNAYVRSTETVDERQKRMPDDRLISPRLGFSEKVSGLGHLDFRIWIQRMLSADNFGVTPFTAAKIQSDNQALALEPFENILRGLKKCVEIHLLVEFTHQGLSFLADPLWQDFQKVRYPRRTHLPAPPLELLRTFSRESFKLFREHHHFFSKHSGKIPGKLRSVSGADYRLTANGSSRSRSTEGESERKPSEAVEFKIADAITDALNKCRRFGAVSKLREPAWWQAEIRANSGKGIDYPAHLFEAEAYLATVPANRYSDLAKFLHNSFRRVPRPT